MIIRMDDFFFFRAFYGFVSLFLCLFFYFSRICLFFVDQIREKGENICCEGEY